MNTVAAPVAFGWQAGWRYGLPGFALAFVALPLYVVLPNYYVRSFGVSLAALGTLLLLARLADAFVDPLLGRLSDRLYARSLQAVLGWGAGAAALLVGGFTLLFFPPVSAMAPLLAWAGACLLITYIGYSLLGILHQSWGAMLGGDEAQRSRIVAWREGLGLAGVLVASTAPALLGMGGTSLLLGAALVLGVWAWSHAPRPTPALQAEVAGALWQPFHRPGFRPLLAVFMVNGIASAIPATLILFFVQDRLQAPAAMEPLFLGSYFLCAALAIPLWLRLVQGIGLARSWLVGMVLSISVFLATATLGTGDAIAFVVVCALSGVALGTDLILPGALLAGTIAANGDRGRADGAYFGWWNFATKLNLALSAGVALPVLGWLGYTPGTREESSLQTLTLAYCLLPCVLKALAAGLLYFLIIRKPS